PFFFFMCNEKIIQSVGTPNLWGGLAVVVHNMLAKHLFFYGPPGEHPNIVNQPAVLSQVLVNPVSYKKMTLPTTHPSCRYRWSPYN
ncbi:hypothetical protein ACVGXS_00250, partial [Enterobacter hormaechei]